LSREVEGCVQLVSRMEQELPEPIGQVNPGKDGASGLGYFSDFILGLGRILGFWAHLSIECLEILNNADPVLRVQNGIEWTVEFALGVLDQALFEPISHLLFYGLAVVLRNFALLDIDRFVVFLGGLVENPCGNLSVKSSLAHDIGVALKKATVLVLVLRGDFQGEMLSLEFLLLQIWGWPNPDRSMMALIMSGQISWQDAPSRFPGYQWPYFGTG